MTRLTAPPTVNLFPSHQYWWLLALLCFVLPGNSNAMGDKPSAAPENERECLPDETVRIKVGEQVFAFPYTKINKYGHNHLPERNFNLGTKKLCQLPEEPPFELDSLSTELFAYCRPEDLTKGAKEGYCAKNIINVTAIPITSPKEEVERQIRESNKKRQKSCLSDRRCKQLFLYKDLKIKIAFWLEPYGSDTVTGGEILNINGSVLSGSATDDDGDGLYVPSDIYFIFSGSRNLFVNMRLQ